MCVMSLLLRCGALTCSHHKQQSHHQSKEQVHLHFASESCVLWQVPHSVSLCQCEVGDLKRGLMCRKCFHMWQCCVPGGGVRVCYLFGILLSAPLASWESILVFREDLITSCGSDVGGAVSVG